MFSQPCSLMSCHLAMRLDINMMLKGNSMNQPWEKDSSDWQRVNFQQQQMKGWGGVYGIKQLSQQSSSFSIYVGLFFSCKLSALCTLLSEFSQLPHGARRRQRWLEMRKQVRHKDNCLAWSHATARSTRPRIRLPNSEPIGSYTDH